MKAVKSRSSLGGAPGVEGQPEAPLRVFRNEMGGVRIAGQPVVARLQGAYQIEAQKREVRQIVGGELLAGQMGVDQAEPPESAGGGTKAVQGRDEDVVMGTHDHIGDLPPAGDEEADLAVDLTGEFRQRPGQFVGDDPIRRDSAAGRAARSA